MSALKVLSLPVDARPRIVELLEELLAKAKEGRVTGILVLHEDDKGEFEHRRDGLPDNQIVFSMELIKRRLLAGYE